MKQAILGIFFSIIILNTSCASTLMQALSEAYKKNPRLNAERENLKISKENIEIIKTVYFETTGKDVDKMIESINVKLENRLSLYISLKEVVEYYATASTVALSEEQFIELKSKGILLWMYDDKLIYALATFLESEKMTIDEIREFLLNNPETWT